VKFAIEAISFIVSVSWFLPAGLYDLLHKYEQNQFVKAFMVLDTKGKLIVTAIVAFLVSKAISGIVVKASIIYKGMRF
jgi:hypothetical protein